MAKDVILFLDTGIDDATALLLALADKQINVVGIVASRGNVSTKQVAKNTISILEFVGRADIPVFMGAKRFYGKTKFEIWKGHGKNGVGNYIFPKPKQKPKSFKEFINFFNNLQKKVSILVVCPLTNLAHLFKHEHVVEKIDALYLQNGMLEDPHYKSFNIACDPKAAEIVFKTPIKTFLCPSDMGHRAYLNKTDVKKLASLNKTGEMLEFMYRSYHDRVCKNNVATHDSCLVYSFSHKDEFSWEYADLKLDYVDDIGVLHFAFSKQKKMTQLCTNINIKEFKKYFFDSIKSFK